MKVIPELPRSIEAEAALLGAIILDGNVLAVLEPVTA